MSGPNETDTLSNPDLREEIISQEESIKLSLDEDKALEIIGRRIQDGESFWSKELGLKEKREANEQRYLNENFEASGQDELYEHEIMYRDNRTFISIETLKSALASKIPVPDVIEAFDTDASRELATNLSKVLFRKAEDIDLKSELQMAARHLLMGYRLAVTKTMWDFGAGRIKDGKPIGEVVVKTIRPHKIILDARAEDPNDVPLIAESMEKTIEELGFQFPRKKDELFKAVGRAGNKTAMDTRIGFYEVYFTFLDKEGIKREGLAWKYRNVLLDFGINPNFNYEEDKTNFFDRPQKPYTLMNFLRIGKWAIDDTSLTEQAASQQDILERRGRQLTESADQASSSKIFNTQQVDAKDAAKYAGDPKQNILVKGDTRTAFSRVPPNTLDRLVLEDKYDARREIDNIFSTHAPLRGEETQSPTLGQEVMSQRSDLGRTNSLSEAIEKGGTKVFKQMTQLYKVYATEEHIVKSIGEETGKTTFIKFSQDKIEDGVEIRIQPGSLSPDDKLSDKSEAIELAKIGGRIDPLTFAEKWHVDKPREFAKRLFFFLFTPDRYAAEILKIDEGGGDADAMRTIQQINSGEQVPPKEGASKEYIATYRQFLESPAFKQLDPEIQKAHIEHIRGTMELAKGSLGDSPEENPAEAPAPPTQAAGGGGLISKITTLFGRK